MRRHRREELVGASLDDGEVDNAHLGDGTVQTAYSCAGPRYDDAA